MATSEARRLAKHGDLRSAATARTPRPEPDAGPPRARAPATRNEAAPSAEAMRAYLRFLRLHRRLGDLMGARLKALGLSVPQTDLLSALAEREGATQQDIADRLHVTKGNISGHIDRLAEAGLVERRAVKGDRRSTSLFLTERGRALAAAGLAAQRDVVARTVGAWAAEDVAALNALLGRWRDGARALTAEEGPEGA